MDRSQLEHLIKVDAHETIPGTELITALNSTPFITPSPAALINIRDLGALPASDNDDSASGIPKQRAYRCGALDSAVKDPASVAWLSQNIRYIFDVRTAHERESAPDPPLDGITNVWREPAGTDKPPVLENFIEGDGSAGLTFEYMKVLRLYAPAIRAILEHVRDRPQEPFLFHCMAGRDRTGVVAGLLQSLAGAAPEDVRFDYLLSRIGLEPIRDRLLHYAKTATGVTDISTPGFHNLVSLRPTAWDAFVAGVEAEHGGWEGYVTKTLGFSDEDLKTIKANLRK